MTRYRLAVEDIEPNRWIAWVLDLPGCFSSAQTESDAVARAPECIVAYGAWLASHDSSLSTLSRPFETRVVETFASVVSDAKPDYIINAFFEDDRRPLVYWEVEASLRLFQWTREDLLAVVRGATEEQLRAPLPGEIGGSIAGVLKHVAGAENWYLGQLGLAISRDQLPEDPLSMLGGVRANTRARLAELVGHDRVVKGDGDELWSGRKVVRRALWHERAHTQHVKRLLTRLEVGSSR
jgi:predicted RNase H-like HicB family nuclease